MLPHEYEAIRFKLLSLFQLANGAPAVNMLGKDNLTRTAQSGSRALLPDQYSSVLVVELKKTLQCPWLMFAYHPVSKNCPDDIALTLLAKAVADLDQFAPSKRERLANLAVIAAMDVRQEVLGGEKCTVQMVCDLAGVYIHNWQRDYREHFKALKAAAHQLDQDALAAANLVFIKHQDEQNRAPHFRACQLDGSY